MHLVLDANEFLLTFGAHRDPFCERLFGEIADKPERYILSICRPTLDEITRNLLPSQLDGVYSLLNALGVDVDERWSIPFEFVESYLEKGLKRGDAFLAGYAEWVRADFLISENRKDLVDHPDLFPFKVSTARTFLQKHTR